MLTWVVVIVAVALLAAVYMSWRAGRLDRLHARVETARVALDLALERRSSVALEMASSGLLDPATSLLLAGAVHDARASAAATGGGLPGAAAAAVPAGGLAAAAASDDASSDDASPDEDVLTLDGAGRPRDLAESDLTRALRAAFGQPGFSASLAGQDGADELIAEMEAAAHQVFLARKFYNDAVAVTQFARRRPLARMFRLAGNAQPPEFFEMDDSLVDLGWTGKAQSHVGGP